MAHTWTRAETKLPPMVVSETVMCYVHGWCVRACDGRLVAYFKTIAAREAWLTKHRFTIPAECPQ